MNIGWPVAIVLVAIVLGGVSLLATWLAANSSAAIEEAKGRNGEQCRTLSADYEKLANETRDSLGAVQADMASLKTAVESMEQMMREVG